MSTNLKTLATYAEMWTMATTDPEADPEMIERVVSTADGILEAMAEADGTVNTDFLLGGLYGLALADGLNDSMMEDAPLALFADEVRTMVFEGFHPYIHTMLALACLAERLLKGELYP